MRKGRQQSKRSHRAMESAIGEGNCTGILVLQRDWCSVDDQPALVMRSVQRLNKAGKVREGFPEEVTCQLDLENTILKSRGKWGFIASRGFSLKKGGGGNK